MLTYSTGLSDKGWAMSTSVSRRWAQEGFVEGTSYDAWAGFLTIEKQFSQDHKLKLVGFMAPSTQRTTRRCSFKSLRFKGLLL